MALATTNVFAAGSSHYGISDLSLLMQSTHKFEAGYLHRLLGTTPRSWKKVCEARSPITLIAGMTAPLVLFQGLDDKVVPPDQSRLIHERLKERDVLTELHEFDGEGHGFRQASTIVKVAEAELAFLRNALRLA
jgi:dipeptidyl aminopeptidase/acylaminoacyl peptidase